MLPHVSVRAARRCHPARRRPSGMWRSGRLFPVTRVPCADRARLTGPVRSDRAATWQGLGYVASRDRPHLRPSQPVDRRAGLRPQQPVRRLAAGITSSAPASVHVMLADDNVSPT